MPKKLIPALCALLIVGTTPAWADDDWPRGGERWHGGQQQARHAHDKHYRKHHAKHRHHDRERAHYRYVVPRVVWHSGRHWSPPARHHHVKHHHKHRSTRYWHRRDDDWAIYAILALQLAQALNDSQRSSFAWAQHEAAVAPIGDSIRWNDGGASGQVVAVREGSDSGGRYCREFQQVITVGGRSQAGYGIACRQPDGAWEIVS